MDSIPARPIQELSWANVGLAFLFIVFDVVLSRFYGLGVGNSLTTAAIRCVIQLSAVAAVLQSVFKAENVWAVAGIAGESSLATNEPFAHIDFVPGLLNIMGTTEIGELTMSVGGA